MILLWYYMLSYTGYLTHGPQSEDYAIYVVVMIQSKRIKNQKLFIIPHNTIKW